MQTPAPKNRKYLITTTQINLILSELQHLKQNCIITPDTDANYRNIIAVLSCIRGE